MERRTDSGNPRRVGPAARVWVVTASAVAAIAAALGWLSIGRIGDAISPSAPDPAADYGEAMRRVDALLAKDDSTVHRLCRTRLFSHGRKMERAVVFLHGLTNCPRQFDLLGEEMARRGWNVLIPRVPHHGLADRMSPELRRLTAEELARSGETAIDIAHGLGDHVTVVGLSSTAVAVAWLAQHRGDLDRAMLIAPSFAPKGMPLSAARALTKTLLLSPNFFVWWNSRLKSRVGGPTQTYPRFASRAMAETYRLGFLTLDEATRSRPAARSIVTVTTAADEGVSNQATSELARRWRSHGARVEAYEYPETLGVHHDMIDPEQPYARLEVSYPPILMLLTEGAEGKPRRGGRGGRGGGRARGRARPRRRDIRATDPGSRAA